MDKVKKLGLQEWIFSLSAIIFKRIIKGFFCLNLKALQNFLEISLGDEYKCELCAETW